MFILQKEKELSRRNSLLLLCYKIYIFFIIFFICLTLCTPAHSFDKGDEVYVQGYCISLNFLKLAAALSVKHKTREKFDEAMSIAFMTSTCTFLNFQPKKVKIKKKHWEKFDETTKEILQIWSANILLKNNIRTIYFFLSTKNKLSV